MNTIEGQHESNVKVMNIIKDHDEHKSDEHQQKIKTNIKTMNINKRPQ